MNPNNGGLIVYEEEAPLDWEFRSYNSDTKDGNRHIRQFLTKHDSGKMVVPCAENRVVLFNFALFHEADTPNSNPATKISGSMSPCFLETGVVDWNGT